MAIGEEAYWVYVRAFREPHIFTKSGLKRIANEFTIPYSTIRKSIRDTGEYHTKFIRVVRVNTK